MPLFCAIADACEATKKIATRIKRIFIMLSRLQTTLAGIRSATSGSRHGEIPRFPSGVISQPFPASTPVNLAGGWGSNRDRSSLRPCQLASTLIKRAILPLVKRGREYRSPALDDMY